MSFGGADKHDSCRQSELHGFSADQDRRASTKNQHFHFTFHAHTRKEPGFTAISIAALALNIGANTAIVSAGNGALLNPVGVKDASRIVAVRAHYLSWASKTLTYPPPTGRHRDRYFRRGWTRSQLHRLRHA